MFELAVALKYLTPRRRQLSVSIIATLSVIVISLVVWLVVVFLSVTHGIERRWIETLVSLNAPITLTPTEAYYNSYYYQVDAHSAAGDYTLKSLSEKLASVGDSYDPLTDPELPYTIPPPDLGPNGQLRDPVKGVFAAIEAVGATGSDYEAGLGSLNLQVVRGNKQRTLTQISYLVSFDEKNKRLGKTLLPVTPEDLTPYLTQHQNFDHVTVSHMRTPEQGWHLPRSFYPKSGSLKAELSDGRILLKENGTHTIVFDESGAMLVDDKGQRPAPALFVDGGIVMEASLTSDQTFNLSFTQQDLSFKGTSPYRHLEIAEANIHPESPWQIDGVQKLPVDEEGFEGILLAVAYRKQGAAIGDRGYIAYYAGSPTSSEEQRIPVYVAGFYDPGLTPSGSKFILVNREVTTEVRPSMQQLDSSLTNGIHVWFDDVYQADAVKAQLVAKLEERGIAPYWKIETYKEYPYAKPLIDQFQSDRLLFSLIALIIIIVACSNIISMLILLVNDKRQEIGIMRAMGASGKSIAVIFALCGTVMGLVGSAIGIVTAVFTLHHLEKLISMLSALQGHEAFNAAFFGGELPNELSWTVLGFVGGATIVISLIAGLIPAIKATCVAPSTILRG